MTYEIELLFNAEFKYVINLNIRLLFFEILKIFNIS